MANALAQPPNPFLMEVQAIENDLAATQYAARVQREQEAHNALMREQEEQQKKQQTKQRRNEQIATSILQGVTSIGGGALSTVSWGRIPVGGILNTIIGSVGTGVTIKGSERPAVRVAGQSTQTLLFNQIAIATREYIRGMP